jgi:hypothetical protein
VTRKVRSARRLWPGVTLAGAVLLLLAHVPAQAGDLDPTFAGKVRTTSFGGAEEAHALTLSHLGK